MGRNIKSKNLIVENVAIETVAAEGNGFAHVEGKVLFVPKTIPGDVVNVVLTRQRKGFLEGRVLNFVSYSAMRLKPFCPHYGICGGCTWQALPYDKQLEFKQQQVEDQLVRIGHLPLPRISPIIGSDNTLCYRNKLEYTFSNKRWILPDETFELSENERLALGFHIPGMFSKVLDIKECKLQAEPSNAIRLFVKEYAKSHNLSFFDIAAHTGLLRNLIIRISHTTGEIMVIIVAGASEREDYDIVKEKGKSRNRFTDALSPKDKAAVEALLDAVCEKFPEVSSTFYVANNKGNDTMAGCPIFHHSGTEYITEKMENLNFRISPKSFYQTNSAQAYKLYSVVRNFAALSGTETVYDLYTGTGTIALFLSGKASKVVGIEYVEDAIEDAEINADQNNISNATFYAGDMKEVLNERFIASNGSPDVIVLDPPRSGIDPQVANVLLATAAPRMVYVSCNPATQARDLAVLSAKYDITKVQPVDMFPHTQHVENVVALELKES